MEPLLDGFYRFQEYYSTWAIDETLITFRDKGYLLHSPPLIFGLLYVAMVMLLPKFLIKKKLTNLAPIVKPWMMAWNLFLSLLSIAMFLGITSPLVQYYLKYGLWGIICDAPHNFCVPGVNIIWLAFFSYSKFGEMLDTVFLILKKPDRPVAFLHWYHHLTVMWFTWYACHWRLSAGMTFASMNSLVHSFMYYYYFQAERGQPPKWGKMLTIGQITQMVIGLIINIAWAWGYLSGLGCSCDNPDIILAMGTGMYASYLILFLKFFIEKYALPPAAPPKKGTTTTTPKNKKRKEE